MPRQMVQGIVKKETLIKKNRTQWLLKAGLRVFDPIHHEEYEEYKSGQIMVFNVSYIDARAITGLSLVIFILIPAFIVGLIYVILKLLIRKYDIHLFKK